MIAGAAEGSARDGLSILDQAIAHGAGAVTAAQVRDMLGLADRGRIRRLARAGAFRRCAAALWPRSTKRTSSASIRRSSFAA